MVKSVPIWLLTISLNDRFDHLRPGWAARPGNMPSPGSMPESVPIALCEPSNGHHAAQQLQKDRDMFGTVKQRPAMVIKLSIVLAGATRPRLLHHRLFVSRVLTSLDIHRPGLAS